MEPELYAAVASGDVKLLTKLEGRCNILQEVTPTGDTALHLAAYHGHVNVVNKLLQLMNGAGNQAIRGYLRVKNEKGNTAFHEAAIGGHRQVIEVLLERDRPPQSEIELQNIISDTRDTPHSIVNDAGDTDLQNVINDGGEITDASEADPQKIISDAAETDLPNITNVVGETALFKAVEEGHEKIVAELLPLTLPQHYWRTDGQTLVHCAVYRRRKEVLKKLIAAKPDLLKQADYLRRTPLHYAACLKGISHIAKIILEKDTSSCYTVDNNHQSALHLAVKEGNVDLVREILKYAKDCIVIGDNEGRNAFHLVIENAVQIFDKIGRRIKTLMFLVISKRLINEADNRGKTPLDIALDNMDTDERLFEGFSFIGRPLHFL
ncbi:ankyrin repeat-containing protein ITN1 isoform X2 [Cryptomeria japonica]|uniref:ankyrin repeat-containing protein ITN1 isoform X2 n=1 Tax=Cryptomeria japonica TaxID=3369 RepID=UPI0027DA679E|nr:ankyrin repeat-containing protein ITN1 isoform X2 [Cryptomeria japonica]